MPRGNHYAASSSQPLPPPAIRHQYGYAARRRFAFTKNPYRQLTCVSTIRLVLGLLCVIFAALEGLLRSRYHATWHLAGSGCFYVACSLLAFLGCAYADFTKHRLLWFHSWLSIVACLFVYPSEVGVMSLELCHDTAWCLCVVHPRKACPQNWPAVPLELTALFITTIAFVLNLLAAVLSRKMWKVARARQERIRSANLLAKSNRRGGNGATSRRAVAREAEEEPAVVNGDHRPIDETPPSTDRGGRRSNENMKYIFVGAAAATAASAAAVPMLGASRTLVDQMNRPTTLLYPQKPQAAAATNDEESVNKYNCALYWWYSPENFV